MNQLSPLYNKSCTCLVCKEKFTTKKVRSRFIKVLKYDTDFYPTYKDDERNPIFYHIHVCPNCGFSFTENTSSYFPPQSLELIKNKISNRWIPQNYGDFRTSIDAVNTYKLAIYCAFLKKEKHIVLGGLYLRTAWLFRLDNNDLQEQRFLKLALKEYTQSYLKDDFQGTKVSEVKLLYLIADLYIRTENTSAAIQYLSKVIGLQKNAVEQNIIEMAKDRWYEIRQTQKRA